MVQIAADQHDAVQRLTAELAASKETSGRLLMELHTAQVRLHQPMRSIPTCFAVSQLSVLQPLPRKNEVSSSSGHAGMPCLAVRCSWAGVHNGCGSWTCAVCQSQMTAASAGGGGKAAGGLDLKQAHAALAAAEEELARAEVRRCMPQCKYIALCLG